MATSDYSPQRPTQDHSQNSQSTIASTIISTPTRHAPSVSPTTGVTPDGSLHGEAGPGIGGYTSSSAHASYFNPDAYFSPHPAHTLTPNGATSSRHDSYDSTAFSTDSHPSTSHSLDGFGMSMSVSMEAGSSGMTIGGEENSFYPFESPTADFAFMLPPPPGGAVGESTPPAPHTAIDDDRTPVISDLQRPIHPSDLPSASNQRSSTMVKPLLSPFRSLGHQSTQAFTSGQQQPHYAQPTEVSINETSTFMDSSHQQMFSHPHPHPHHQHQQLFQHSHPQQHPHAAYYHGQQQHYAAYAHDPATYSVHANAHMAIPMPLAMAMPGQLAMGQYHNPNQPYYASGPASYDFGPPRSRNGSPTGSVSSSIASSLARSASTSSELRQARPKVKLTKEDKRNIVELHRTNTSLRQEDIARQYGVDRSTISKIIISAHRWTAPEEIPIEPVIRQPKTVGGRFPAVEEKMSEWMDMQIAAGLDVRDSVARDQAKLFAMESGLGAERFKASAKWLDKFKDRRKAAGKPVTSPVHANFGYYPYGPMAPPTMAPLENTTGPGMLSRSHSAMTLSSSSTSSQEQGFLPSPACIPMDRLVLNRSEPDLIRIKMEDQSTGSGVIGIGSTPTSRARSQSSPHTQTLDGPAMQTPSSGKVVRPSPLSLQRQNSYHGTSPSPRRPAPPSRANSSQGPFRRSRPGSLAASAFGITPLGGDEPYSPVQSPTTGTSSGSHSRQRSEGGLTPFTTSMSVMTISPDMSDSGDLSLSASTSSIATMPIPLAVPPLTPMTPISPVHAGVPAVFPALNPDLGDYTDGQGVVHQQYQLHGQQQQQLYQGHQYDSSPQHQHVHAVPGHGDVSGQQQQHDTAYMTGQPGTGYSTMTMPNKHYAAHEYGGYPIGGEFGQGLVQQEQRWQ